jgi:hypothetical protein
VAGARERGTSGSGIVLLTLAAGQFLMTLDTSVMNVSIATVADDVDTTVTGIQTAITIYTLVMASLMITGGKLGQIFGRKRVFGIGWSRSSSPTSPRCRRRAPRTRAARLGVDSETADAIIDENETARLDALRSSLAVLAVIAVAAVLLTFRIPTKQPGSTSKT